MKDKEQLSWLDLWEDEVDSVDDAETDVPVVEVSSDTLYPSQLVDDFEQFIEYFMQHQVSMTKTKGNMARKALREINERVSIRSEQATMHSDQIAYPYLDFLFQIALRGKLITKITEYSGSAWFRVTDRVSLFQNLSHAEKYLFILETFWVDTDWESFPSSPYISISQSVQDVFYYLLMASKVMSGQTVKGFKEIEMHALSQLRNWNRFLLYFEWLGIWECEIDEKAIEEYYLKNHYFSKAITLTKWGEKIIPILFQDRNAQFWNIPLRQDYGEVNPVPGSPLEELIFILPDDVDDTLLYLNKKQGVEPFIVPFRELCGLSVKESGLQRDVKSFVPGRYTFKVMYTNQVWRTLVLFGEHTMEQLHKLILRAYNFSDEHLYSFFMDGKKWSDKSIVSPLDGDGMAIANKVRIGDLGLSKGQSFTYLYDYGDEWTFTITVEQIEAEMAKADRLPHIQKKVGEAPEQYIDWGW